MYAGTIQHTILLKRHPLVDSDQVTHPKIIYKKKNRNRNRKMYSNVCVECTYDRRWPMQPKYANAITYDNINAANIITPPAKSVSNFHWDNNTYHLPMFRHRRLPNNPYAILCLSMVVFHRLLAS